MTEIKKITKIALLVIGIPNFLFGILLLFIPDMLMPGLDWTNPLHPRVFGGVCLIGAIFSVIMLRKKEWEEIKLMILYFICMLGTTIIIDITLTAIIGSTIPVQITIQLILEAILMGSMLALAVVSYIKQER